MPKETPKDYRVTWTGDALDVLVGLLSSTRHGEGLGLTQLTSYFVAVYAVTDVLPRVLLGRVFDKVGAHFVIYPGIVLYVVGQFFLGEARTGFGYLGSAAVLGLGYGALFPSFLTLAVQSAAGQRKGYATSTYYFFFDAGVAAGSLLLGLVAGHSDYHTMYFVSAIVVAFTMPLYYLLHHRPNLKRSVVPSVYLSP